MSKAGLPESFISALQSFLDWLAAEQVPYTLIGGVAVSLLAKPRTTQDIDAVIWLDATRWPSFLDAGVSYGFVPRISEAIEFANTSRVLLLRHEGSGISIDISCGALEFEREMIERATTFEIGALRLKVPTPEDLLITKAFAHRPKDSIDLDAILSMHRNLDAARVRYWIKEFADTLEMPEIFDNLEKLLQQYHL